MFCDSDHVVYFWLTWLFVLKTFSESFCHEDKPVKIRLRLLKTASASEPFTKVSSSRTEGNRPLSIQEIKKETSSMTSADRRPSWMWENSQNSLFSDQVSSSELNIFLKRINSDSHKTQRSLSFSARSEWIIQRQGPDRALHHGLNLHIYWQFWIFQTTFKQILTTKRDVGVSVIYSPPFVSWFWWFCFFWTFMTTVFNLLFDLMDI